MVNTVTKKLERFFLLLLFINPFIDILNGLYIYMAETLSRSTFNNFYFQLTPVLVLRMGFLVLFAAYLLMLRDKKAILTLIPIGAAWVLSLAGEFLFAASFSLFTDLQYVAKFVYNLSILLVYFQVFQRSGMDKKAILGLLNRVVVFTLNVLSLSILFCYVIGFGYSTYGDRFGYFGFRGIFYSGNDITAVLMLLLPFAIVYFFQMPRKQKLWHTCYQAAAPASALTAMFLIGTKTAFLAIIIITITMLVYSLIVWKKQGSPLFFQRLILIILICIAILGLLMLFAQSNVLSDINKSLGHTGLLFGDNVGLTSLVLSGRQFKLRQAIEQYAAGGPFIWLFGVGRGSQQVIIEMDLFEVLAYYGIFGLAVMLWLYVKLGFMFMMRFFKKIDLTGLACFVSLGMCVAYLIMAGHILFSVTSGLYFSLVLIYASLYQAPIMKKWDVYEHIPKLHLKKEQP